MPTGAFDLRSASRDARLALACEFEDLAKLQRRLCRIEAAIGSAAERVIEFERQFGIGIRARLDAPPCRDADVALRRSQARIRGKSAAYRLREHKRSGRDGAARGRRPIECERTGIDRRIEQLLRQRRLCERA